MSYNHYESYTVEELWEKLASLANEHQYEDSLDDPFGNIDYSITHIKCIAEELAEEEF